MKTLSNEIIRKLKPCYDPAKIGIAENEVLSIVDWVTKYRKIIKSNFDIIWLLCRPEFMSDRDMRLFAVWCAREALKLVEDPDPRSIEACEVAERYADGEATREELADARIAALDAGLSAAWSAAMYYARDAVWDVTLYDASTAQIDKLLTYFK
jgi:hypothetical protein